MEVATSLLAKRQYPSKNSYLFFGSCLFHPSSKRLRAGETCRAGQTVVTWFCVLTEVDSIVGIASIGNFFALVNVFAGDTVPGVAQWTFATLERAIREARAPCSGEAWV